MQKKQIPIEIQNSTQSRRLIDVLQGWNLCPIVITIRNVLWTFSDRPQGSKNVLAGGLIKSINSKSFAESDYIVEKDSAITWISFKTTGGYRKPGSAADKKKQAKLHLYRLDLPEWKTCVVGEQKTKSKLNFWTCWIIVGCQSTWTKKLQTKFASKFLIYHIVNIIFDITKTRLWMKVLNPTILPENSCHQKCSIQTSTSVTIYCTRWFIFRFDSIRINFDLRIKPLNVKLHIREWDLIEENTCSD